MKNIWIFLLVLPFLGFSQQNDTIPKKKENQLEEVVISGTLKAVKRLENPVPVEIITATFLKQNPTSNVFDALQNVNGLRPQNNCNVCNTGDIRINGLDGPYTMVTIDGMPIVSALGSVYGLSGIPNSMIEKIEVVKGAASTLYGSEAVGGLINIITKRPKAVPQFTADIFSTSWLENNIDIGYRTSLGKKADVLIGVNYFNGSAYYALTGIYKTSTYASTMIFKGLGDDMNCFGINTLSASNSSYFPTVNILSTASIITSLSNL